MDPSGGVPVSSEGDGAVGLTMGQQPALRTILMLHNYYRSASPSGENESFEQEVALLNRKGHSVITYTEDSDTISIERPSDRVRLALRTIWSRDSYLGVIEFLRRYDIDVVHVQNAYPLLSPSVYQACFDVGVPVVQSLRNYRLMCVNGALFRNGAVCYECVGRAVPWRGVLHGSYKGSRPQSAVVGAMIGLTQLRNIWSKQVHVFVATSEYVRRIYMDHGFDGDRIIVKPNLVYPDPGVGDHQGGFGLYAGRLSAAKGVKTLLSAMTELHRRGDSIPFKIVGDGALREEAEAAANWIPGLEVLGQLDRESTLELMKAAAYVAIPSEWDEPFGRTAIEAYATGAPVLASSAGGLTEIVDERESGLLVSPGDVKGWISALSWTRTNSNELERMGLNGRRKFELSFSDDVVYEKLVESYDFARLVAVGSSPVEQMDLLQGDTSPARRFPSFCCCSVRMEGVDLDQAVGVILETALGDKGLRIHLCNADVLARASRDADYRAVLNRGDFNLPDGTPIAWLGRRLGIPGAGRPVPGAELMVATLHQGVEHGIRHYLYGAAPETVRRLAERVRERIPGVQVVGIESPPFRELTTEEEDDLVVRVRDSGAQVVWVGLGTPKQDYFVDRFRDRMGVVLVPVGAAFDFLSGTKRRAPQWMRRAGLEWLHRFASEPRRLWRRYLIGNLRFLLCALRDSGRLEEPRQES